MQLGNLEQVIRDYLPNILHLSLGTCRDNQPWVCEVHFVYDDDLNLYFRSKPSRRHSRDIADNPRVAGNIVTQHALGEKPRGIYFEGRAELVKDQGVIDRVWPAFIKRLGVPTAAAAELTEPDGHQVYCISVATFFVFDVRESKPAQKYELAWHR